MTDMVQNYNNASWNDLIGGIIAKEMPEYFSSKKPSIVRPIRKKPKRIRTAFTTEQILSLEKVFQQQEYIDRSKRLSLVSTLGLSDRNIKVWFQNRRMKKKKDVISDATSTTSSDNESSQSPPIAADPHSNYQLGSPTSHQQQPVYQPSYQFPQYPQQDYQQMYHQQYYWNSQCQQMNYQNYYQNCYYDYNVKCEDSIVPQQEEYLKQETVDFDDIDINDLKSEVKAEVPTDDSGLNVSGNSVSATSTSWASDVSSYYEYFEF